MDDNGLYKSASPAELLSVETIELYSSAMKILLTLSIIFFTSPAVPFEQAYKLEYLDGLDYLRVHRSMIDRVLMGDDAQKHQMLAIVFPELLRYSLFKDFFETKSVQIGYVNFGSDFVDFSIGHFQMKPSFVESLEEEISQIDSLKLKYFEVLTAEDSTETWRRQERVNRLSSLAGQLLYLSCFYELMEHKYRFHFWASDESRLRFYATAYNHGFTAKKAEIQRWEKAQTFPFGMSFKGAQYVYADVSLHYYQDQMDKRAAHN